MINFDIGLFTAKQRDLKALCWVLSLLVYVDEARYKASSLDYVAVEFDEQLASPEYVLTIGKIIFAAFIAH